MCVYIILKIRIKILGFGLAACYVQLSWLSLQKILAAWSLGYTVQHMRRELTQSNTVRQSSNIHCMPASSRQFPCHWPSPSISGALALQRVRPEAGLYRRALKEPMQLQGCSVRDSTELLHASAHLH